MEAADGSTSSETIIQFSDPNNLFDDVAPLLQRRLPLTSLHWKSSTRPLRSIAELDVSLEREQAKESVSPRHQIPGLRQTPFVKILLLRCDDKEQYKESVRKDAKDWVKSLGISSSGKPSSKGQERHDAFEYMILHVVLPGTVAAIQPKSSKHISVEATESTDSVNSTSKSKWTGKSTSTVFDKLKADFASSSKAPFERVVQIRLTDPAKPSNALSPLEIEEQWQSLVEKLKTAILQSFDSRVAQYEEDIREREAQRSLPGWNFCTFFILKEGLARGFENVGLLDDALQIYEELAAGLDAVITDHMNEDFNDTTNTLLPYAPDLKDIIRAVLDEQYTTNGTTQSIALNLQSWSDNEAKRFPWKLERRNYQKMILTNQVSALDFRIYMFIREMQIMLRKASLSASISKSRTNRQTGVRWDADTLSEICRRSIQFMSLAARNLRQDLFAAWGGQEGLLEDELITQQLVIDNIVASWKWASCLQILTECQIVKSFSSVSDSDDGEGGDLFNPGDIARSQRDHSMSISTASSGDTASTNLNASTTATKDVFAALKVVRGQKSDFVFYAAEIFTMMRTILLELCARFESLPAALGTPTFAIAPMKSSSPGLGVRSPTLHSATQSEDTALKAYKLLTVCACQCYTSANKSRAARQLLFDLAKLELHGGRHDAALEWLDAVPGFLDGPPKTFLEQSMLDLYISCLRTTDRRHDLLRCLYFSLQSSSKLDETWAEMVSLSAGTGLTSFSFIEVFELVSIANHITHDQHGELCIIVKLKPLIPIPNLGTVRLNLSCQSRLQSAPVTFKSTDAGDFKNAGGTSEFTLKAQFICEGWYDINKITLSCGNLQFEQILAGFSISETDGGGSSAMYRSHTAIYIYASANSPCVEARQSSCVSLTSSKKVTVFVTWGAIGVHSAQLRLRPATAGLRLDIVSASVLGDGKMDIQRITDSHLLVFQALGGIETTTLEIPYSFDSNVPVSASIKAELEYTTVHGQYQLHEDISFMPLLPVSINVQDIFQVGATFSRFSFAPSRAVPLSIIRCDLSSTSSTTASSPAPFAEPVDAFPKQPVNWIARIDHNFDAKPEQLQLQAVYQSMDEVVLNTILESFTSALATSVLRTFTRLVTTHLKAQIQALWTEQDLEIATLASETEIWTFDQLDWMSALGVLAKTDRLELAAWLRQWHNANKSIKLSHESAPVRSLELMVDPPYTQLLIKIEMKLQNSSRRIVVGQPILVQIICSLHLIDMKISAEICLDVVSNAQADAWLIGGQRKIMFPSSQAQFSGTIVLVPQRTGKLVLPSIDVKCRNEQGDKSTNVSFEVDNINSATMVEVVSAVQSTTVAIGDGEIAEGSWLVESRRQT